MTASTILTDDENQQAARRVKAVFARMTPQLLTVGRIARAVVDVDVDEPTPERMRRGVRGKQLDRWRLWLRSKGAEELMREYTVGWDGNARPAVFNTRTQGEPGKRTPNRKRRVLPPEGVTAPRASYENRTKRDA